MYGAKQGSSEERILGGYASYIEYIQGVKKNKSIMEVKISAKNFQNEEIAMIS